ncbi:MAG: TOBE domain-containing protein, partial [Chloroflexota bacterium]|nr:TOBE domain-containing protein [Chloroflexota bacterium]
TDPAQGGDHAADENRLAGTIIDASYSGVSTQYVVRVDGGTDVAVYAQNLQTTGVGGQLAAGKRVHLIWQPQHSFVIRRTDQAGHMGEAIDA